MNRKMIIWLLEWLLWTQAPFHSAAAETTTGNPSSIGTTDIFAHMPNISVEQITMVAGHKATIEISIEDVSLPTVVRLFYHNGSSHVEIGSSALMNSILRPGRCFMWKFLDVNYEWFYLQRVFCKQLRYDGTLNAITIKLWFVTYPVSSKYAGNFTFRVGTRTRIMRLKYADRPDDAIDRFFRKEVTVVTKDSITTEDTSNIQNYQANYPFTFDLRPSSAWIRQGSSADIILLMSNFEPPVYLLHKTEADGSFVHFYTVNVTNTVCNGVFHSSVLFANAHIKSCTQTGEDGQYSITVLLQTVGVTARRADESFLAASYSTTISEDNRRMMELAKASLTIKTYSSACRAENDNELNGIFPSRLGASVTISCTASCLQRESAIKITLEKASPLPCCHVKAICDGDVAIQHIGNPGDVTPDCRALVRNGNMSPKVVAKFSISDYNMDFEGLYHCFVDSEGIISSYPVSVYVQKKPKLALSGSASNSFESLTTSTPLTCHATNGQPPARIVWLLNKEIVQLNASYTSSPLGNSSSVLQLPMNHEYNGNEVRCQTVPYGALTAVTSRPIKINFYHLPLGIDDQIINSNSTVNVSCSIFQSNPPISANNCSMSTWDGKETKDYTPLPDAPILVEPGQSLKVRCSCNFKFIGKSATPQYMIYVNWKGALDLVAEVSVLRYVTVYVAITIGGLTLLMLGLMLLLRQHGYTLEPPLPDYILAQLASGQAVIEKTVSTEGYKRILIKQHTTGTHTSAGLASVDDRHARLQSQDNRNTVTAAAAAGHPEMPMADTTMLAERGATTKDMADTTMLAERGATTKDDGLAKNLRQNNQSTEPKVGKENEKRRKRKKDLESRRASATTTLPLPEAMGAVKETKDDDGGVKMASAKLVAQSPPEAVQVQGPVTVQGPVGSQGRLQQISATAASGKAEAAASTPSGLALSRRSKKSTGSTEYTATSAEPTVMSAQMSTAAVQQPSAFAPSSSRPPNRDDNVSSIVSPSVQFSVT